MICSVKAQALASGQVDEVLVHNVNGDASAQIAGIRNLISSGANAIIVNPADREALNPVIKEADARGIVVVAVDQAVTAPEAYVVTNDQVAYGRLGAEWLAKELGGKGNIVEMRGISGVPADDDRHKGFMEVIEQNPDMKVVKETFTDWSFAPAGKQANDILNSNIQVDGIWTSGIDYVVVDALKKAGQENVPVIGADNNKFLEQLQDGAPGAAVTNPAAIGGVGTAIAIQALNGENPEKHDHAHARGVGHGVLRGQDQGVLRPEAPADVLEPDDRGAVHDLHQGPAHRLPGPVGRKAPIRARA